jgi:hypothetical protein
LILKQPVRSLGEALDETLALANRNVFEDAAGNVEDGPVVDFENLAPLAEYR